MTDIVAWSAAALVHKGEVSAPDMWKHARSTFNRDQTSLLQTRIHMGNPVVIDIGLSKAQRRPGDTSFRLGESKGGLMIGGLGLCPQEFAITMTIKLQSCRTINMPWSKRDNSSVL